MTRIVYILIVLLSVCQLMGAYNILFMLPFGSKSHKIAFDPVAEELAKRGHQITLFSHLEDKREVGGVRSYQAVKMKDIFDRYDISFFHGHGQGLKLLANMFDMMNEMINLTYSDPLIKDLLKNPKDSQGKNKYDLLVMDACFNDFVLPIAHHVGIPSVIFSPAGTFTHQAWNLDVPFPYAVHPSSGTDFPEPMSFGQRAFNTIGSFMFTMAFNHYVLPKFDEAVRKFLPNSPTILELERNVSFMISNSLPAIGLRKPTMPYAVEIGGLSCHPAQPLPKDLEDFMQGAGKDGVIYFSLGSHAKGESMPLTMRAKFIEVFAQLPNKILWKYEKDIPSLPKNVKLVKWAPQQDLLGHPQMRLFISHGGGLSTSESAYHGCPILGFPLSADQEGNMAQAKRVGYAEFLKWETFTAQQLVETINNMLNDKRYKDRAVFASIVMKDRALKPVEEAAYWIEYVVKHNGAPFLKSSAGTLNLFQYFLLDVIAFAALVLIVLIVVIYYVLRFTLRFACGVCQRLGICPSWCPIADRKAKLPVSKKAGKKKIN